MYVTKLYGSTYGKLDKISHTMRIRRMKLAGHVFCDKSSTAQALITWIPTHGVTSRGRPATYPEALMTDANVETTVQLEQLMANRVEWRNHMSCSTGCSERR